jgi:UDP-4-amino-4,6-dideoxy-N-acetyl-beta-L-altrosamine N-acetyltransferase
MLARHEITKERQSAWFAGLNNDASRAYFVMKQDARPIGMLYFSEITHHECIWGCYLGETNVWPGSGLILEMGALRYAFDIIKVDLLRAEVFAHNEAPLRMRKVFGYVPDDPPERKVRVDDREEQLKRFFLKKSDWKYQKESLLMRLPASIRVASEQIEFSGL